MTKTLTSAEKLLSKGRFCGLFDSNNLQVGLAENWRLYTLSVGAAPAVTKDAGAVIAGKKRSFGWSYEIVKGWKAKGEVVTVSRDIQPGEELTFKFINIANWYEAKGICNTFLAGGQSVSPVHFYGDGGPKLRIPKPTVTEEE